MPSSHQDKMFKANLESIIDWPSDLLDRVISWVEKNLEPDEVFSKTELEKWAESNGYSQG